MVADRVVVEKVGVMVVVGMVEVEMELAETAVNEVEQKGARMVGEETADLVKMVEETELFPTHT